MQYAGISAGWGYCISFDHSHSRINLFSDKRSWFAKMLPASMQSEGYSFELKEDEKIKDVSCGRNHFLVLSFSGKGDDFEFVSSMQTKMQICDIVFTGHKHMTAVLPEPHGLKK